MRSVAPRRWIAARVYYGWVVAAACLLASMAVFGTSYAFGVFFEAFLRSFDASRAALAAAFGLQTCVLYAAGVGAGRLVGRHGQRRVAAAGGLLTTVGLAATAAARSYAELLLGFGVVSAAGMAGLYVVGYATVPLWFRRRRGTAAGIAAAGLGVGLVAVPPATDRLIAAAGWRPAMALLAAAVALVSLVVVGLLADRPDAVGADVSVEFGADGWGESGGSSAGDAAAGRPADGEIRRTVRSRRFALVFVGWVLAFAPLYVVLSHVVLHAGDVGVGRRVGVLAVTAIGAATTVSRVGTGVLSDRFGRVRTFVACAAVMGVSTAAFGLAPAAPSFLAIAVAFGVGYGGCGGLLGPVVADLFGSDDLTTLYAVVSLSFAVAGLAAPPLAGRAFDALGTYTPALVAAGAAGVLGAGCVAAAGVTGR